jgi:hypothetical protein
VSFTGWSADELAIFAKSGAGQSTKALPKVGALEIAARDISNAWQFSAHLLGKITLLLGSPR